MFCILIKCMRNKNLQIHISSFFIIEYIQIGYNFWILLRNIINYIIHISIFSINNFNMFIIISFISIHFFNISMNFHQFLSYRYFL